MKTIDFKSSWSKVMLLLPLLLAFITLGAFAQDKKDKEKSRKETVTIHITKEDNGKLTVYDTTFTTEEKFEIDSWLEARNLYEEEARLKEIEEGLEKEIRVTIPHFSEFEGKTIPDTIIVNEDTIFLGLAGKDFKYLFHDMPGLEDLEIEKYFDKPMKHCPPGCRRFEVHPRCCPHPRLDRIPDMPFLLDFDLPELDRLFPFGNLDNIVVKKKRNGKKIIIEFEDDDDDISRGEKNTYHYYFNDDDIQWQPEKGRKIIIEKDDTGEAEEGTEIKRIKDGDKEVIIIRKKAPGQK